MSRVLSGTVAVLGGTFDPVHSGHVGIARALRESLDIDRVLLVPASIPPHKRDRSITPANHRLAMLRLAVEPHPGLVVDPIELERGGVSFTIDTLRAIRARPGHEVPLFVVGIDSIPDLPRWRAFDDLVREFDLLVVDRPGEDLARILAAAPEAIRRRWVPWPDGIGSDLPPLGAGGRVVHVPLPPFEAASRDVRERIAGGGSPGALVPPAVARYIRHHGLYSGAGAGRPRPETKEGRH